MTKILLDLSSVMFTSRGFTFKAFAKNSSYVPSPPNSLIVFNNNRRLSIDAILIDVGTISSLSIHSSMLLPFNPH